jgi:hypothetical protein
MADTIHVRGEGGMVIAMDLPLPGHIEQRLTRGQIRRVNEDGTPYTEPADGTVAAPPSERPPQSAAKELWVGWAVTCGALPDDAEAMTKGDLIDKYGREGDA